ncbi:signal recognition particle GTPase [sediment metagenome]|uniref:Signal recognition particle GTPase n=1 Tax=sediment metagenome TaxID=749907 RepID=D9PEV9_9ZZZZ
MFGKLKEKLKNWAKKVSEKAKETEEVIEEKSAEKLKKESKKKSKEKKKSEKIEKELVEEAEEKLFEPSTKEIEEKEEIKKFEATKEIELPMEYNTGAQKFEPDLEKLKEKIEEKISEPEKSKPGTESFFKRVTSKISKVKISEEMFNVYAEELEMLLLENNVALEVAEKVVYELKEKVVGKELLKKEVESEIQEAFKEIIRGILVDPFDIIKRIKEKKKNSKDPFVMIFCGVNGTGKTTTISKIASHLKSKGISCVLAAGDTFRAASIEQLKTHGEKIGVKVIANDYGSDPASVGFDAIKYAKKNLIDCVLIDTAGRMHTSKNLLKEIEKMARVCKPDLKIFVGESITGNDAIEQVKTFNFEIGIDGIVLTKADIDEKGGTALSVGYVTKKPILYLGTGQEYDKIEVFNKEKFIEKLGL